VARRRVSGGSKRIGGTKMLSWSKVRRTLEILGWDPDQFIGRYESARRRVRKPDSSLLAAGEEFDRTGDLDAFRSAVVARTTQELYAKLGRYQVWKAANGSRTTAPEAGA
jgi:hypothetical protein